MREHGRASRENLDFGREEASTGRVMVGVAPPFFGREWLSREL
jgi:hypothetical protein